MKSVTHKIQHGSKSTKQHFYSAKSRKKQSQITSVRDDNSNALYTSQAQIERATCKYWFHPQTGVMRRREIDPQAKHRILSKIKKKLNETQARRLGKGQPPTAIVSLEAIEDAMNA